jgi:hypothetical protein
MNVISKSWVDKACKEKTEQTEWLSMSFCLPASVFYSANNSPKDAA